MKKIMLSIFAIVGLSSLATAGGGYSPAVEPIVEVPEVSEIDHSGSYIGLGVSAVITYEDDSSFFNSKVRQERTGDIALIGGYDFNQYIGVEGRYMTSFTHEDRIERDLWAVYVKPQYPVMEELNVYALLGYGNFQLEGINGNNIDIDESGFQWGVGVSYEVTENISIFADYVKIANDVGTDGFVTFPAEISSDAVTVGVIYHF